MAQLLRSLIISPASNWPLRRCIHYGLYSTPTHISTGSFTHRRLLTGTSPTTLLHRKNLHVSRSVGLSPAAATLNSETSQTDSQSDSSDAQPKSRNQKKREAQRADRWGMKLAEFSETKIKRILRVASLNKEVYDALMLVKTFGRDVREGKRRQYNYIGKLLRDVDPELMDGLIEATKYGDEIMFKRLSASVKPDTNEEEEEIDFEDEDEDEDEDEQGFGDHHDIATKWFDGLVNKDVDITNEVYALSTVDFDRQELRKLVRNFCSLQVHSATSAENKGEAGNEGKAAEKKGKTDKKLLKAKKSLTRFLITIAKQLPTEESFIV